MLRPKSELSRKEIGKQRADIWDSEQRNKNKVIFQETIDRQNINNDIIRLISEGKGKIETLAFLNNKYPNSRLSKYFESWYNHHKERKNRKKPLNDFTR